MPSGDLDEGLLAAPLDILEAELRHHLTQNSSPLAMEQPDGATSPSVVPSHVPAAAVQKLNLILDCLVAHDREEPCVSAYVDACGGVVSEKPSRSWSQLPPQPSRGCAGIRP
jgi:hypothetical protein